MRTSRDCLRLLLYAFRVTHDTGDQESELLLDPYAKLLRAIPNGELLLVPYRPLGRMLGKSTFDWQGDRFPKNSLRNNLLFMRCMCAALHTMLQVASKHPGTFLGIVEKIPYLKDLGVNAIELLPIHEFNETEVLNVRS